MKLASITSSYRGPKPKLMRWAYKGIVWPALSYASLAWGHAVEAEDLQKICRKLNRLAMNTIIKVPRSTPTRALEIIFDIHPLLLHIMKEGLSACLRHNLLFASCILRQPSQILGLDCGGSWDLQLWRGSEWLLRHETHSPLCPWHLQLCEHEWQPTKTQLQRLHRRQQDEWLSGGWGVHCPQWRQHRISQGVTPGLSHGLPNWDDGNQTGSNPASRHPWPYHYQVLCGFSSRTSDVPSRLPQIKLALKTIQELNPVQHQL